MAPKTLARRLPAALLVTLVASAALTFGIGAAYASGEEPLPETFGIQPVRQGDRGTYEASGTATFQGEWLRNDVDETRAYDGGTERFEWRPARQAYDETGEVRMAAPLYWGFHEPYGNLTYGFEMLLDHHDGTAFAERQVSNGTIPWYAWSDPPVYIGLGERTRNATYGIVGTTFDVEWTPCGMISPLQGASTRTAEPLKLGGRCGSQGGAIDPDQGNETGEAQDRWLFEATAVEQVRGYDAVRYEYRSDEVQVKLWYAREVSAPVKVEKVVDFENETIRVQVHEVLELVAFEAGNDVYPSGQPAGSPALPPVVPGPAGFFGPDSTGMDTSYTIEMAWQDAATNEEFRSFIGKNPDAFPVYARSLVFEATEGEKRGWAFLVKGPDEVLGGVTIQAPVQEVEDVLKMTDPLVEPFEDELPWAPPFARPLTAFVPMEGWASFFPDKPMTSLPTVGSVAAMWQAFDDGAHLNGPGFFWGFSGFCLDLDCSEAEGSVFVGQEIRLEAADDDPFQQIFGGESIREDAFTTLAVRDDGRILSYQEGEARAVERHEGLLPTSPAPETEPEPTEEALATTSPFWQWPSTPEAAAGVGFLGVLVGVLYWLWPTLKGGLGVGLFSRLRQDQVLAHPMREGILAAVEAEPGLHQSELQRRLGTSRGTLDHHLKQLLARGLVVRKQQGGYVCFFPGRGVGRDEMEALTWLRGEGARDVLVAVDASPGCNGREVARSTGLDAATVSYHLKRLREGGLVEATREGRALVVRPTALGSRLAAAS
ncbi:MAG: winged helix-turn-helix transcriptional regulator [Thermoplasmatota archaeon]